MKISHSRFQEFIQIHESICQLSEEIILDKYGYETNDEIPDDFRDEFNEEVGRLQEEKMKEKYQSMIDNEIIEEYEIEDCKVIFSIYD